MGHAFQTSDEQYAKLAAYAAERGQTPETLFQEIAVFPSNIDPEKQ